MIFKAKIFKFYVGILLQTLVFHFLNNRKSILKTEIIDQKVG